MQLTCNSLCELNDLVVQAGLRRCSTGTHGFGACMQKQYKVE